MIGSAGKITTEGRKAALDLRLVDSSARDHPESKANLAVHEILRIWQETKADRLTQLVFCDLSTPKDTGFSVYDDVKTKLARDSMRVELTTMCRTPARRVGQYAASG